MKRPTRKELKAGRKPRRKLAGATAKQKRPIDRARKNGERRWLADGVGPQLKLKFERRRAKNKVARASRKANRGR